MGTLDTYRMLGKGTHAILSYNYLALHLIVADEAVFRVLTLDVIVLAGHVGLICCRGLIGCFNFGREWAGELSSNEGAYIRSLTPKRVTVAVEYRSDLVKSCTHPSGSVRASSESPMPNNSNFVIGSHWSGPKGAVESRVQSYTIIYSSKWFCSRK